jgi:hypothetical protein
VNLADEIKKIEDCKVLTSSTKDTAIREIIDHYRASIKYVKPVVKIVPSVDGAAAERKYSPLIEKVISMETTFFDEYNKLGPLEFILTGNGGITGGDKNMPAQIKIVDEAICRVYKLRPRRERELPPRKIDYPGDPSVWPLGGEDWWA